MFPKKTKLDKYVDLGLLRSQTSKVHPLTIYVYTEFTTYERLWNDVTLSARGLVFDDKGRCIVRCLPKFFNLDEPKPYQDPFCDGDYEDCKFYDKLDGSLIQVVNDPEYGLVVTSKGSFNSDQSNWATEIIEKEGYVFVSGITHIFELIHPENKIVVEYGGDMRLDLLAGVKIDDGVEVDIYDEVYSQFNKVKEFALNEYADHLKNINVEGVIVHHKNGKRVKIKTEEYVRLHRIVTNFTEKRIWEMLVNDESIDLVNMPEEFEKWYEQTVSDLENSFKAIELAAIQEKNSVADLTDKEVGLHDALQYKQIVFLMRKDRDYKDLIWKMIKPKSD